jgi:hypothetical protein
VRVVFLLQALLPPCAQAYSFGILMWELLSGSSPYKGMAFGQVHIYMTDVIAFHHRLTLQTSPAQKYLGQNAWSTCAVS